MSAIRLLQAERKEEIQHLHRQFMSGGILQRELWEEAEKFLIQREIYDVILAEEQDLREYKQTLLDSGNYTKKQVKEQSSALRKIQKYWIETEYGELLLEIRESQVSDEALKGNIKRFLIRQGIHHIKEIDYTVRSRYEAELKKMWDEASVMRYLKVFDHIKQYSIQKEIESLPGRIEHRRKYQAQVVFLPYLPDLELVKDFEYVRDKQELVWDFFRRASEKLKKQVFLLLNYILDNLYRDDPKERRVRYLLPLHWLYDFCVEEEIDDLEGLELEQIQRFEKIVEQKVVNVKNSMQIIDNSRKILFLTAPEIHWHANVWYMERFHLSEDRLNPSNPVQRLSFIEVTNKKNRELLQEYAKYHVGIGGLTIANIRGQLYEVKRLLEYFKEEESICQVDENQLDDYFRKLEEKDTKDDTFNKRIVHYIKFYQFLNVRGYMKEIPFKPEYYLKKTYPEHHDRTVEEKVYMEILHKLYAFPLVPRLIFLHLWCTGLRISEVCTLKGDAYYWDGEDAWLKVYQIKMKADKMIPIPLVMYRIMRKYIEREHIRPKDYIFKGKDGGAYRGTTFRQEFQQYCDKNGIADGSYIFKTHDYRHTLATQFYDEDVSIQTIRDYLGHFSEEMTKQYVDFMPKRIEKASHYVSLNEQEFVYSLQEESAMKDIAISETVKNRIERNQKRVHELDMLIRKIYEDNVIGRLPDRLFQSMLTDYENEQNELNKIIETDTADMQRIIGGQNNVERFLKLVKKYENITELTPAMINEFIDKILVHEPQGKGADCTTEVEIYLNYVGQFQVPVEQHEPTEEERIAAEKEAERLRRKRESNRKYMKKIREKSKEFAEHERIPEEKSSDSNVCFEQNATSKSNRQKVKGEKIA